MKLSLGLTCDFNIVNGKTSPRLLVRGARLTWLRNRLVKRRAYPSLPSSLYFRPLLVTPERTCSLHPVQLYTKSLLVLSNKSRIQKARAKKRLAQERLAKELLDKKLRIKELFTKHPYFKDSWPLLTRTHLLFFVQDTKPHWFLTQLSLLSLFSKSLSRSGSPRSIDTRHPLGSASRKLTHLTLLSIKL